MRLEGPLLAKIGLIGDEAGFNRAGVRLNTATFYKQQKFNLLREENEGYSGLINEIVGGMGPTLRAVKQTEMADRVVEQESAQERNNRARNVMNNISALIGYFDLDPNRVLDVILDVFSANVVRHWPFFLALLAASPWGKGKGKSSTWQTTSSSSDAMQVDTADQDINIGLVDVNVKQQQGHHVIAQMLGFKFGFYQQLNVDDEVPEELYLMSAILIREGHVRLVDLYTHLSPDEAGMSALHEKYKQSMSDKVMSAKGNALSMAAPLTEEGAGLGGSGVNSKRDKGEGGNEKDDHNAPNQILGLLRALLGIGHLKGGLFILARYPWLCGAFPPVADLYSRLLGVIVTPAYASISIQAVNPVASNPALSLRKLRYDVKRQELVEVPSPTPRITSIAPEPQMTLTSSFVYFYSPWKQELPGCEMSELLSGFIPLLRLLGPHLHRNTILFQQVCRLVKVAMESPSADQTAWLEVVRNLLLPALTMTAGNSGLVSEVWGILRQLPYIERYNLYGEWKYALYRRPELRARQAETEKEAKGILKRISSDNVKQSGRSLAKSSHANPTVFFTVALNQVQSYSNLIAPIVESAKFLTRFEYDVFGFNLIDALSNPEKERTKQDGTSVSMWLQSLAAFTGTLYKRYALMDCTPILQYIANQLRQNNSKDLVIIRELILKMAGIEPLANLSDAQVAALTGGRRLRTEAMMVANASVTTLVRGQLRKSGARLLHALTESRLAMPLLLLIAQQRQACVYLVESGEAHLKYLGNLFDTCQEILFQYVEFLQNHLEPQEYSDLVPSLDDMCSRFALEPAIAFHIARPRLLLRLRTAAAKENEERLRREVLASKMQTSAKEAAAKSTVVEDIKTEDVEMKDASDKEDAAETKEVETESDKVQQVTVLEAAVETVPVPLAMAESIWNAAIQEAVQAADNILPDDAKRTIGVHFYATFWQLSLADIAVPADRYEQEKRSLQQVIDQNPEGGRKSIHKFRIQAQEMQSQLRAELKEQTMAHAATRRRLQSEKDHWFGDQPRNEIIYEVLQHCIVPRALLSPTDAIFAGRFLRSMHSAGTRNFSSLTAYDRIIMDQVAPLVFSCTENEIRNYARFLQIVLTDLNSWYKDEDRYIKEAFGDKLPGFQLRWADRHGGEAIPEDDLLTYDKYRVVFTKWQGMLRSIFRECLTSKEYMRIRNTIVVMTRIASQFPLLQHHGNELLECISVMTQQEDRGDLKILGQGLLATLRKQQKTWQKKKQAGSESAPASEANTVASQAKVSAAPPPVKEDELASPKVAEKNSDNSSAVGKKAAASSQETGEATPPRKAAESTTTFTVTTSTSTSTSKSNGTGVPSADVLAARKAALESMNNTAMNPPRTVASTASAQASRDRQANSQRDRETTELTGRAKEREVESTRAQASPRSAGRSRETSPGTSVSTTVRGVVTAAESDLKRGHRAGSKSGSRAGSEEGASRNSRGDREQRDPDREKGRDRDRDRNRDRDRDWEREKDRSSSSRRDERHPSSRDEHTGARDRERGSERDRDRSRRDQESRSQRSDWDRGAESRNNLDQRYIESKHDDRIREEDRRKPGDRGEVVESHFVPTGPRSSAENGRKSGDGNRNRTEPKDMARSSSSSHQTQPTRPAQRTPTEPASSRPPRELFAKVEPEAKEDNDGSRSPASMAKKRTLADRLSASGVPANGASSEAAASPSRQGNEEEPNKKPRINRNRVTDEGVSNWDNGGRRAAADGSTANTLPSPVPGEDKGISILGQARGSGQPPFQRRDTRNGKGYDATLGRGAAAAAPEDHRRAERDRPTSGSHHQSGRHGGDRDRRRKERRSGHE